MTNSSPDFLFPPAPQPSVAVKGLASRFPVKRIFCVARNYAAHAVEMGSAPEKTAPVYFTKSPHALVASGAKIPYPPGTSDFHYEMELVVALGKDGFDIPRAQAVEYIYGYACGLDMTRRDLQAAFREKGHPWDTAKDFENAAVISEIVPANPGSSFLAAGAITLSVNGETRQSADLADMLNDIGEIISDLSRFYRLCAGDLIYTGTPAGVGSVTSGDLMEGAIAGVGEITLEIA
ncbi:MAG: fumarylacetoacetate hydrolase family protein [Pseudomonadota bacterium]